MDKTRPNALAGKALRCMLAALIALTALLPASIGGARTAWAATDPMCDISWEEAKPQIENLMGTPYVWGGRSTSGWDCSGFVSYVMHDIYGTAWPGGSWGNAGTDAIAAMCAPYECFHGDSASDYNAAFDRGDVKPGDVIVFSNSAGSTVHAAIAGDGQTIYHAWSESTGTLNNRFDEVWGVNGGHGKVYADFDVYRMLPDGGFVAIAKASSNEGVSGESPLYSLEGAEFGLYKDGVLVETLVTDAEGKATTKEKIESGSYVLREHKAPAGFSLGAEDIPVTVRGSDIVVEIPNDPQSATIEILAVKHDAELGEGEPQGDASLAGAVFEAALYPNLEGDVSGEPIRTWTFVTDEDGKARPAVPAPRAASASQLPLDSEGAPCLPLGTYAITEVEAPEGYLLDGGTHVLVVSPGGEAEHSVTIELVSDSPAENGAPVTSEEVIRGGVQVVKADAELGESEALGGSGRKAEGAGSTLSGIEFTVTNESEHGVLVEGEWHEPGEPVAILTTEWNEGESAYTAQTASDALPYGTYAIQETATNDSYLLTDGEPRVFSIREDGVVVTANDEGDLTFFDQVIRNDLEIAKKAEPSNESLQVPFLLTNVSTGEAHVLVADRNGNASTASSWNAHSSNTNGNDHLMGHDGRIEVSEMDARAGIWFSLGEDGTEADVDDSLGALPYGEYLLEELPCEANEGLVLVSKSFWVERDSSVARAIWMSIDDEGEVSDDPFIKTTARDSADGDQVIEASVRSVVVDAVAYGGLTPGATYVMEGTLVDKTTGEALRDASGNEVKAYATFEPGASSGEVEVTFEFDSSLLSEGAEIVVFERCLDAEGNVVASHEDLGAVEQTVVIDRPETPEVPDEPYDKTGLDMGYVYALSAGLLALGSAAAICFLMPRVRTRGESDEAPIEE